MSYYKISFDRPVMAKEDILGKDTAIVVHELQVADSEVFLLGTYDRNYGEDSREFIVCLSPDEVPPLDTMTRKEIFAHFDTQTISAITIRHKDELVFSKDGTFANPDRLAQDIVRLATLGEGTGHIPLLAQMGQEHEGFVPALESYLNGGHGVSQSIKLAMLDQVGIGQSKLELRERLLHNTATLKEFGEKLAQHIDLENRNTRSILTNIANAAYAGEPAQKAASAPTAMPVKAPIIVAP